MIGLVAIPLEIRAQVDEQERALQVMAALAGDLPDGMTMVCGPWGDFWAYTLAQMTAPLPPACGDWPANDDGCVRDLGHEPPHRDLRGDTWWP